MENIAFIVIYVVLGIAGLVSSGFFIYGLVGYIVNRKKLYIKYVFYSLVALVIICIAYYIVNYPTYTQYGGQFEELSPRIGY